MNSSVTVYLRITGQFGSGSFPDWICHRAGVLNLTGWVTVCSDTLINVKVSGETVLIEAMEVACGLGPCDILVDSIDQNATFNNEQPQEFTRLF